MKRKVRYFVSYAHDDGKLPGKLTTQLHKHLGACKDYEFERWQDTDILVGEKWHDQIQKAIAGCEFGLLLVSPAFLSSHYIGEHELPHFVNGLKPCLPVALCRIDFQNHDLKGLEESQIFHYQSEGAGAPRAFADYNAKLQADFALKLFTDITGRLKKIFADKDGVPVTATIPRTAIPHNLPHLPHFFGRDKELKTIADALSPKTRTWGVLIDGPGGMGKTSLAIKAAESVPADAFQRILFLSSKERKMTAEGERKLSQFVVPGYLDMLNEIARQLGKAELAKLPEADRARSVIVALEPAHVLLILDNLESLPKEQQNQLFEFLSQLPPGCKAIVTSRRRTDVDARIIRLGKLEQEAALALLAELEADRPLLKKAGETDRIHLYEETGGNPLLLRWIVGQLGRGSCRTLADALALCRRAEKENDPLEFIFGDLLETFTDAETKALAALTYFTQMLEVKDIAELAGLSKTAAQTALSDLANRALVVPDEEEKCFALVPMVADFLRHKRPEVINEMGDRLEKQVYALVMENGYEKYDRFPVLNAAWPSIAAALPRFLTGEDKRLQTVCGALFQPCNFSGRYDESLSLNKDGESHAMESGDFCSAGWRALQIGWVHYLRGQSDEVLDCADRAEAHWRNAKAGAHEQATAIRLRGVGHQLAKDYPAAIAAYREAVALWRNSGRESTEVATGLSDLADVEMIDRQFAAAERDYREALRIDRIACNHEGVATVIGNLAELALMRDDWPGAEALAREALSLTEKIGRQQLIASNSRRLAHALMRQGKKAEALPHARRAVEIYQKLGSPDIAVAQRTLAECES
jgi:tetratricopeptide (TPR) repeat protein